MYQLAHELLDGEIEAALHLLAGRQSAEVPLAHALIFWPFVEGREYSDNSGQVLVIRNADYVKLTIAGEEK